MLFYQHHFDLYAIITGNDELTCIEILPGFSSFSSRNIRNGFKRLCS